jgi:hypothetical protein
MAWHENGTTPKKGDMMEMSQVNFYRVLEMRDEIIDEQRVEISKLKAKLNQLRLKLK